MFSSDHRLVPTLRSRYCATIRRQHIGGAAGRERHDDPNGCDWENPGGASAPLA